MLGVELIIEFHGISPEDEKLAAIAGSHLPQSEISVKSFLVSRSDFRRSVANFAVISEPMARLTRKSEAFNGAT